MSVFGGGDFRQVRGRFRRCACSVLCALGLDAGLFRASHARTCVFAPLSDTGEPEVLLSVEVAVLVSGDDDVRRGAGCTAARLRALAVVGLDRGDLSDTGEVVLLLSVEVVVLVSGDASSRRVVVVSDEEDLLSRAEVRFGGVGMAASGEEALRRAEVRFGGAGMATSGEEALRRAEVRFGGAGMATSGEEALRRVEVRFGGVGVEASGEEALCRVEVRFGGVGVEASGEEALCRVEVRFDSVGVGASVAGFAVEGVMFGELALRCAGPRLLLGDAESSRGKTACACRNCTRADRRGSIMHTK
jgi:hypothetical protein